MHDQAKRDAIIKATLQTRPKGMTHWSCRTMARAQGVSRNTVNRLWQLHNLKPHLHRTFKLSRDPKFLEKLTDVVEEYFCRYMYPGNMNLPPVIHHAVDTVKQWWATR